MRSAAVFGSCRTSPGCPSTRRQQANPSKIPSGSWKQDERTKTPRVQFPRHAQHALVVIEDRADPPIVTALRATGRLGRARCDTAPWPEDPVLPTCLLAASPSPSVATAAGGRCSQGCEIRRSARLWCVASASALPRITSRSVYRDALPGWAEDAGWRSDQKLSGRPAVRGR